MARAQWLLNGDRPIVEIVLTQAVDGMQVVRTLLADTGAGNTKAPFELLLEESDCLMCGGKPTHAVALGGAYSGSYPLYTVRVQIPQLSFDSNVAVVGVSTTPQRLDGIACFRFLNRFTYGNLGDKSSFSLQT